MAECDCSRPTTPEGIVHEAGCAALSVPEPPRVADLMRAAQYLRPPHSGYAPEQGRFIADKVEAAASYLARADEETERWKGAAADAAIERDEAREALRDARNKLRIYAETLRFYGTAENYDWERGFPNGSVQADRGKLAHAALKGVERTHALVPVEQLREAANDIAFAARCSRLEPDITQARAEAFAAAARGENPTWPETRA